MPVPLKRTVSPENIPGILGLLQGADKGHAFPRARGPMDALWRQLKSPQPCHPRGSVPRSLSSASGEIGSSHHCLPQTGSQDRGTRSTGRCPWAATASTLLRPSSITLSEPGSWRVSLCCVHELSQVMCPHGASGPQTGEVAAGASVRAVRPESQTHGPTAVSHHRGGTLGDTLDCVLLGHKRLLRCE